ncbi:solute carrier family 20 [Capsaspora owczarzaki ATCC 30864]|uniref:Phosphate transporter n=1 Tax=Capsaspora owczarzaki (strain ATCC 30864) TaxID=595528 RepID=A0A0D2WRM6_CAPO3|nr:solute carrier family 20 [Capsaspora owczarzaki ATCC 30864]KJE94575.1 solute carrier family 20 [Capsaspora owczarzaki ATCC 30864]|eukprot:XP_004346889.1 solute carrier family 20 [Capsaspora owczarzaki ATCC 30864]
MDPHDYTWILGLGFFLALLDAYGIGANDVANSFATSVASRTLTLRRACMVAIFTEFGGAVLLGSNTAETIRNGILKTHLFAAQPETLMLAMMCALVGSATFILTATRFGAPVSTTHSIVGAIIGTGIAAFGTDAVDWTYDGVGKIITSWFLSPIIAGIIASLIYLSIKFAVLRSPHAYSRSLKVVPILAFVTIGVNAFFIVYKGSPALKLDKNPLGTILGAVFGFAVGCGLLAYFVVVPIIRQRIEGTNSRPLYKDVLCCFYGRSQMLSEEEQAAKEEEEIRTRQAEDARVLKELELAATKSSDMELRETNSAPKLGDSSSTDDILVKNVDDDATGSEASSNAEIAVGKSSPSSVIRNGIRKVWGRLAYGWNVDVVNSQAGDVTAELHARSTKFSSRAERTFQFCQLLTCIAASIAHGSNDVANAIGPIASIYYIWEHAAIAGDKTPVDVWLLAVGGIAINIGLVTYGYKIMSTLGNKMTDHTPSRGFSMELGATFTVLTASKLGLPVSTTHCITGATAAVGLCNGDVRAINWKLLAWCFFSWIITLPCAGLLSGLLYAMMLNSPKFL